MSATRRIFPETFKREAIDRVTSSGLSVEKVATELGLHETVLRRCRAIGCLTPSTLSGEDQKRMPGQSNSVGRVDDDGSDILDQSPELPSAGQRWTVRRKAAVVEGVRGGWMPIEEACRLYNISVDEFLAWERDIDRNGIPGLRSTRYQIYRDTDVRRG